MTLPARPAAVVSPARTPADLAAARVLFIEYAATLPFDLAFQAFEAELAGLPGKYGPPAGDIWLARLAPASAPATPPSTAADSAAPSPADAVVGCLALRPLGQSTAELKRLYVAPAARGSGAGAALLDAALAFARSAGYARVVLDTLDSMDTAAALYRRRGFRDVEPYYDTPEVARTVFMALELEGAGRAD